MPKDRFSEFEAGGFTVDYIGTVTRCRFDVNPTYGFHTLRAFITTKFDTPQTTRDGKVITERTEEFNVGPTEAWEAIDDGRAFRHVSGDPEKWISAQSDYAELLVRVASLGAQADLEAQGDPSEGAMWEGTRWHWTTESKPYKVRDKGTGKTVEGVKAVNRPSEYLGTVGAPKGGDGVDLDSLGLTSVVIESLEVLAKDAASEQDFVSKGLALMPSVSDEQERGKLLDALGIKGLYEALLR